MPIPVWFCIRWDALGIIFSHLRAVIQRKEIIQIIHGETPQHQPLGFKNYFIWIYHDWALGCALCCSGEKKERIIKSIDADLKTKGFKLSLKKLQIMKRLHDGELTSIFDRTRGVNGFLATSLSELLGWYWSMMGNCLSYE